MLTAFVARLAACRLLQGRTLADQNVRNSPLDPIAAIREEGAVLPRPLIAVYTSDYEVDGMKGRDFRSGSPLLSITFQIWCPSGITIPSLGIEVGSGAGHAMAIDIVERQIIHAFETANSPWREVWNNIVSGYKQRGGRSLQHTQAPEEPAIPLKEMTILLSTIEDPPIRKEASPIWDGILTTIAADSNVAALEPMLRAMIENPALLGNEAEQRFEMGLTDVGAWAAGIYDADPPPTLSSDGVLTTGYGTSAPPP